MICENCRLKFDEKLGTVCPHCLTNHVYFEGKLKHIILNERCKNCGANYHLISYWITRTSKDAHIKHKKIPNKECPNCKTLLPLIKVSSKASIDNYSPIIRKPIKEKVSMFKLKRPTEYKCPECSRLLYNTRLDGVYYYCPKCKTQYPI